MAEEQPAEDGGKYYLELHMNYSKCFYADKSVRWLLPRTCDGLRL